MTSPRPEPILLTATTDFAEYGSALICHGLPMAPGTCVTTTELAAGRWSHQIATTWHCPRGCLLTVSYTRPIEPTENTR